MQNANKSQSLVIVLVVLVIVTALGGAFLQYYSRTKRDITNIQKDRDRACSLAKSGFNIASQCVSDNPYSCSRYGTFALLNGQWIDRGSFFGRYMMTVRESTQDLGHRTLVLSDVDSTGEFGKSTCIESTREGSGGSGPLRNYCDGWIKSYGTSGWDLFYSLEQTPDGGYIMGGFGNFTELSPEVSAQTADMIVKKTNSSGDDEGGNCTLETCWRKSYGGDKDDGIYSIKQLPLGTGYMLAGVTQSESLGAAVGKHDFLIIKTDQYGNVGSGFPGTWARHYGSSTGAEIIDGHMGTFGLTSDGGTIMCGYSNSFGTTGNPATDKYDIFVNKTHGLIHDFSFEEASGDAIDTSGNKNNGVLFNGATRTSSGNPGSGMSFDGTDDYVNIEHSNSYLLDNGTVMFWFKADSLPTVKAYGLWSKDHCGSYNGSDACVSSGGHLTFDIGLDGMIGVRLQSHYNPDPPGPCDGGTISPADVTLKHDTPIVAGQWYHVAFTFGKEGMKLYVDGGLPKTDPSYTIGLWKTAGGVGNYEPIVLGASLIVRGCNVGPPHNCSPCDLIDFFDGTLDEVRMYNRALTQTEIQNIMTTNADKGKTWARAYTLAENAEDACRAIQQTPDGGYILSGELGYLDGTPTSGGDYNPFAMRLDSEGVVLWATRYGLSTPSSLAWSTFRSVVQTDDGGFAFAGSGSGPIGSTDMHIVRTDSSGRVGAAFPGTWRYAYGTTASEGSSRFLAKTHDNGFIYGGRTSRGSGRDDQLLIKVDKDGNLSGGDCGTIAQCWSKRYIGQNIVAVDSLYPIALTADGGYIFGGHCSNYLPNMGGSDFVVTKIDEYGNIGCCDSDNDFAIQRGTSTNRNHYDVTTSIQSKGTNIRLPTTNNIIVPEIDVTDDLAVHSFGPTDNDFDTNQVCPQ